MIFYIKGYGFVEFKTEDDADYSIKIMHMVKVKFSINIYKVVWETSKM